MKFMLTFYVCNLGDFNKDGINNNTVVASKLKIFVAI